MKLRIPDKEELDLIRQYLAIDELSPSRLRWIKSPGPRAAKGAPAMLTISKNGYYSGQFLKKFYLVHRIIFFLDRGWWPKGILDHADGDKLNNDPANLREVDHFENGANSKARGYYWVAEKNCWKGVVKCGDSVYTKLTSSEKEARDWYEKKKLELYPQLKNTFYWNSKEI